MKRYVLPLAVAAVLHAGPEQVSRGVDQFGLSVYRQLAPGGDNLIFSPFSISSALSMALAGARGETAAQMAGVLHQAYPDSAYPDAFKALIDQIVQRANTDENRLLNANSLWVQSGFRLEPAFRETLGTAYGAPPAGLDFAGNLEAARRTINSWTEEHTKGKIPELFGPGSLDSHTRLVLTSAVYFYGKWERPFLTKLTFPAAFKLDSGAAVQADFMRQTARFGYAETPSLQILEMKYAGTGLALDILLPKPGGRLADLQSRFTFENLTGWLHDLHDRNVDVTIPKFRAESQFSLRKTLSHVGMANAFTGSADFSGIDGAHDLTLADVRHKAFVDVAEEGTEAAAATGTAVALVRMVVPDSPVFRADHPFFFLIRDTRSGLILFAGQLTNAKR
jgi:serine protease inhibitor